MEAWVISKHISSYILIYIQFSWKILHFKKSIINLLYLHGTIHNNDHLRRKHGLKAWLYHVLVISCWFGQETIHDIRFNNWMVLIFKTLRPFTHECSVQDVVEIGPMVPEKKILNLAIHFRYLVIIYPWIRTWPYKLESPSPMDVLFQNW